MVNKKRPHRFNKIQWETLETLMQPGVNCLNVWSIHDDWMRAWLRLEKRGLVETNWKERGFPVVVCRITEAGRNFYKETGD